MVRKATPNTLLDSHALRAVIPDVQYPASIDIHSIFPHHQLGRFVHTPALCIRALQWLSLNSVYDVCAVVGT